MRVNVEPTFQSAGSRSFPAPYALGADHIISGDWKGPRTCRLESLRYVCVHFAEADVTSQISVVTEQPVEAVAQAFAGFVREECQAG